MNKLIVTISLVFLCSCAQFQTAQPYFEAAAAIGTQEFLATAKTPEVRAKYVATIKEVSSVIATLSSGTLLTPEQFATEVLNRIPKTDISTHFVALVSGVYAVAYAQFKDRPELKNEYISKLAAIIAANAN